MQGDGGARWQPTLPYASARKEGLSSAVLGIAVLALAGAISWFNEWRSAKIDALCARGKAECKTVKPDVRDADNRGHLVHVQGRTRAGAVVEDPQFKGAVMSRCLKLQSTVEVFEWVQLMQRTPTGNKYSFHAQWVTKHQESLGFNKPSPENPRLPLGLRLGTTTTMSPKIFVGEFLLPKAMASELQRFEDAGPQLPSELQACDMAFVAGRDGYYFAKSNNRGLGAMGAEPCIGDVRARFMYVPEGDVTVVAVQCGKGEDETFVPYRPIAWAPCIGPTEGKQRLIEEGERPKPPTSRSSVCNVNSGPVCCCCSCFFCPCSMALSCCNKEVVTEEIFYLGEGLESAEEPFLRVVHRSAWRVALCRAFGLALMYLGVALVLLPVRGVVARLAELRVYRGASVWMLTAMISLAGYSLLVAAAAVSYRPLKSAAWVCVAMLIVVIPCLVGDVLAPTP